MTRAIGIDLGTTYTVVATIRDGRPEVVPNIEGQRLTPSVVCFPAGAEPLVGEPARRLGAARPDRTVFSIKRRMGSGRGVHLGGKYYAPEEVSALIVRKVKADAERRLGERIDRAVITVPAYFNDRQRQATRAAAALAGLEIMQVINEPTAAALAYGVDREEAHTVLVWDLGGGTFDVSILELGEGIFEVRAVSGDSGLGGDDWDSRLQQVLAAEYARVSGGELPDDAGANYRLRETAEQAKRELSSAPVTSVRLPPLGGRRAARSEVEVSRERFEALTGDLLQRMVAPTRQVLADAGLSPEGIDRVILVGGATRMPAVRRLARSLFNREPYRYIQPDEVVARGAALRAGMILGQVDRAVLLDVLPLSLGVETQGGLMARIILRNTPLPASQSRIFTTAADGQTSIEVHVLQGERELASENVSLQRFQLDGIPPAPRGVAKVEVAFEVEADGIAHVSAQDLLGGNEVKTKVASTKSLDPGEITHMAEEALRTAAEDLEAREQVQARIGAQDVLAVAERAVKETACADVHTQQIAVAASELREALESGGQARIQALSRTLRERIAPLAGGHPGRPGSRARP
ncbi:MAG: Hsp70 family protein [Deltaproteobacteria bacterium]|nr:Hsp70 family protein [Deltaproteobacteria bacterium]